MSSSCIAILCSKYRLTQSKFGYHTWTRFTLFIHNFIHESLAPLYFNQQDPQLFFLQIALNLKSFYNYKLAFIKFMYNIWMYSDIHFKMPIITHILQK